MASDYIPSLSALVLALQTLITIQPLSIKLCAEFLFRTAVNPVRGQSMGDGNHDRGICKLSSRRYRSILNKPAIVQNRLRPITLHCAILLNPFCLRTSFAEVSGSPVRKKM